MSSILLFLPLCSPENRYDGTKTAQKSPIHHRWYCVLENRVPGKEIQHYPEQYGCYTNTCCIYNKLSHVFQVKTSFLVTFSLVSLFYSIFYIIYCFIGFITIIQGMNQSQGGFNIKYLVGCLLFIGLTGCSSEPDAEFTDETDRFKVAMDVNEVTGDNGKVETEQADITIFYDGPLSEADKEVSVVYLMPYVDSSEPIGTTTFSFNEMGGEFSRVFEDEEISETLKNGENIEIFISYPDENGEIVEDQLSLSY